MQEFATQPDLALFAKKTDLDLLTIGWEYRILSKPERPAWGIGNFDPSPFSYLSFSSTSTSMNTYLTIFQQNVSHIFHAPTYF
jgi:hypothetical protein